MPNAIRLPTLLPHQEPIRESAAPRKVLRCGRRYGKSRFAMVAAIDGHGPRGADGKRKFPGVLQGMDVVWVAQDYPNLSTVMWREEFVPRFKHLPFVDMNANEHVIAFRGLGTLFLRPETAIDGIRGIGKRLGGVIVDEAAWLDLERALKDVIMAALLDNEGWLILMSTTNAGPDGNTAKRVPSYFNQICSQIQAGERGPQWQEFTGTAFDNPRLSKQAIDELVAEYTPGSVQLEQEVFAKLLTAGVGLALDEVSAEKHLVPRFKVPDYWTHFGAFDWGHDHPYVFGWFACDEDGTIYLVDSVWGRGETPDVIGTRVRKSLPVQRFDYTVAGHDCWQDHKARGENVPTIAEQMDAQGVMLTKASISRVAGLNNVRAYVQWRATEHTPERTPRFYVMDTPNNRWVLKILTTMQKDPKKLEDALKVNAPSGIGQDGFPVGGDDAYDMVRYGLASRPIVAELPKRETVEVLWEHDMDSAVINRTPDSFEPSFNGGIPSGF